MCFAPADEKGFFDALGSDSFDAKAVCSTIDAMEAMASVEEDKTMITERIKEEVGIDSYNEQVRQFLEQQYKFVALRSRGRQPNRSGGANGHTGSGSSSVQHRAGGDSSGGEFTEVLKHLRRLDLRLGGMEKTQEEVANTLGVMEKKQEEMAKKQEEVANTLGVMEKKQEEVANTLGVVEKKQEEVARNLTLKLEHCMGVLERPTQ
jgi:hypothetical protein